MAGNEEEIYSIMFTSLKHPVRRKILRMLANKAMTFKELGDFLGVSSSHLTYHLESLGELISKNENGKYRLSAFGVATVSAMKGVEEAENEPKRRLKMSRRWKVAMSALLFAVMLLTSMFAVQYVYLDKLYRDQNLLEAQNQQLRSWGVGTTKVANLLSDVAQIDIARYKVALLSNTMEYRTDFHVAEEVLKYSLTSTTSNLDATFRFRDNHLSRYQLTLFESAPIFTHTQPRDVLENAKNTLYRYYNYSGDQYLKEMSALLTQVNQTTPTELSSGNLKLKISQIEGITDFLWFHTEKGIDYTAKSLRMTFQNNILVALTDGYFLFTIGNTNLAVDKETAVSMAKNYVKTLTWTIEGRQTKGFNTLEQPISVELIPHPRDNSPALLPYWYVVLRLDTVYSGGINQVTVGIYADTGQVADVQMLSG